MKPLLAGLEDYLPLLFFLVVWWISSKKKKTLRQKPANGKGQRFDLQEILRQLLTGEVEMPRPPNSSPVPRRPVQTAALPAAGDRPAGKQEPARKGAKFEKPAAGIAPPRTIPAPAVNLTSSPPPCRAAPPPLPAGSICRRSLRSAVIWSEILGPPVSLREE